MAFSLRKTSERGSIGLDIDGRYLAAAQVHGGRVTRCASQNLPDGLVRDGEVSDPGALAQHLKSFASAAGLPRNVRLGVANQQIVVRVVELPRIEDERQRDAAVRFQALEAVKIAGLKAEGVDLDAFALVRALSTPGDEEDESARVFCHLAGVTNLAVAVGSSCFFTRPLSAVWDEEDAGSRLADEIRLSIDYYMTQPQAKPVGEV